MITRVWVRNTDRGIKISEKKPLISFSWELVWAKWAASSYQVASEIDERSQVPVPETPGKTATDEGKEELEIWRRLLRKASWFTVERKNDRVKKELFQRYVEKLEPKVAEALLRPVKEEMFISHKEGMELYKQGVTLFGSAGGVAFPSKAIKMYCERQLFWEKFGESRETLARMPVGDFLRLKRISHIEIERSNYEREAAKFRRPPENSGGR